MIDSVAADPTIPGALLYAESPRLGLEWSGAAGVTDVATGAALPAVASVRIASNTKTYVAADLGGFWRRLFERGVFENGETLDTMMTSPCPPRNPRIAWEWA